MAKVVDPREVIGQRERLRMLARVQFREAKVALNEMASRYREATSEANQREFIQRNRFTGGSFRMSKANQKSLGTLESEAGTINPYLETQEVGGTKTGKGGKDIQLPTDDARGGSSKKLPRIGHRPGSSYGLAPKVKEVRNPSPGKAAIQRLVVAAKTRGSFRFIYWDSGTTEGIYRVTGKQLKRRRPGKALGSFKVRLMVDVGRKKADIRKTEWAKRAQSKVPVERIAGEANERTWRIVGAWVR